MSDALGGNPVVNEYGQYSSETEVRARYEDAKREVYEVGHGPLARLAVVALWFMRRGSIRRLRRMDRRDHKRRSPA